MSVRINGQELPDTINEIKITGGNVEIDGAAIVLESKIEIDIEADLDQIAPSLRGYVEKGMRANEP